MKELNLQINPLHPELLGCWLMKELNLQINPLNHMISRLLVDERIKSAN